MWKRPRQSSIDSPSNPTITIDIGNWIWFKILGKKNKILKSSFFKNKQTFLPVKNQSKILLLREYQCLAVPDQKICLNFCFFCFWAKVLLKLLTFFGKFCPEQKKLPPESKKKTKNKAFFLPQSKKYQKKQNFRAKLLPQGKTFPKKSKTSEQNFCLWGKKFALKSKKMIFSNFLKFLLSGTTGRCGICCLSFSLLFSASCLLLSLSLGSCGLLSPWAHPPRALPSLGTRGRRPRVPFPDRSGVPVRPNTEAKYPDSQKLHIPIQKLNIPISRS